MCAGISDERAAELHERLTSLMRAMAREEAEQKHRIDAVLPRHREGARNLAHYLRLRREDIHCLQLDLAAVALSSLGRSEGHVYDSLRRAAAWLEGKPSDALSPNQDGSLDREKATHRLHENTQALFGPRPANRHVYIMVTAPDASEAGATWADDVLKAGADLLRINGAYGSPEEWTRVASTFKSRSALLGKQGRVIVDLPGPKFRIQVRKLEAGVIHLRRQKDRFGRSLAPISLLLVAEHRGGAELPIPPAWLALLEPGDVLDLVDSGGRARELLVGDQARNGVIATCDKSLYFASNLQVSWRRGTRVLSEGRLGALPPAPCELRLAPGDIFLVQGGELPPNTEIPELLFSEPRLLAQVRPTDRIVLDDGKIVGVVESVRDGSLLCRVKHTIKSPARLRSGKGVAFPDSELTVGRLGPQDDLALAFALEHADAVGVSFVNSSEDVALVGGRIARAGKADFGMLLKLETRSSMRNLPGILFEAMKYHPVGLMIARGDLAVELSFERLAEMQEELLWFGEACHLPVVWATQVLDTVARCGVPTRAEVTDAAMSMRAECVMLNKGPHIAEATRMLSDIICRMEPHQYKKRSLYRKLSIANATFEHSDEAAPLLPVAIAPVL